MLELNPWRPDCGGDWVLSGWCEGLYYFANYWPDNTVTASISHAFDGRELADSGIESRKSLGECFVFAEQWICEQIERKQTNA